MAAYRTVKGEGIAAAAEDVKTKQPLRPFCTCKQNTVRYCGEIDSEAASQMAQAAQVSRQHSLLCV